jgi:Raf kinase inhibitor-like YbhB/YbcL family protein
MTITSSAFMNGEEIPAEYTCDGDNKNPALTFSEIPEGTKCLALIMDDPDAPNGLFTHWTIYNMTPTTLQILENDQPKTGFQGATSFGTIGYGGPCPPEGSGTHRYFFRLIALDCDLEVPVGASREALDAEIDDRIIETVTLMGTYSRD